MDENTGKIIWSSGETEAVVSVTVKVKVVHKQF